MILQTQDLSSLALLDTAGTFVEGQLIVVGGRAGGIFSFKNMSAAFEDGGRIIAANGGGSWSRVVSSSSSINAEWYGAKADGVTDDTGAIQSAIDSLSDQEGGVIDISSSSKFFLANLRFSQKVILTYYSSSDLSGDSGHTKAINEQYRFIANANANGVVNEYVIAAPFHPGLILDARKDIEGHAAHLGDNQSIDDPVRASFIIRDEGMNQLVQQYKVFPEWANKYSGWSMNLIKNTWTLSGVGKNDFVTEPKVGDLITVVGRRAKGTVFFIDEDQIEVQWLSGKFLEGDQLVCNGENCAKIVANADFSAESFSSLTINRRNGFLGIGLAPAEAVFPLMIGGRLGIGPSIDHGQYLPEFYKEPGVVFTKSHDEDSQEGLQILLKNGSSSRLILTDRADSPVSNIGAVTMHTGFGTSGSMAGSSFNVNDIEKLGVGDYMIEFADPLKSKNFQVGLSTSKPLEYAYVYAKTIDKVRVRIVRTGTDTPVDPTGVISVICTGGDII